VQGATKGRLKKKKGQVDGEATAKRMGGEAQIGQVGGAGAISVTLSIFPTLGQGKKKEF